MNKKYAVALGHDKDQESINTDKFMSTLKAPEYEKPDYWETRYKKTTSGSTFEWLESYKNIKKEFYTNVLDKVTEI
jgi:hypothetical protein